MLGHSGYLETARRALVYTRIESSKQQVGDFMQAWQQLSPFPEVLASLQRLKARYQLVVLSNGEPRFLDHLVKKRIHWDFDDVISVATAEPSSLIPVYTGERRKYWVWKWGSV